MIGIGIIGLGAIGQRLIKQFKEHPEVKIVAICDPVESLLLETSSQLGRVNGYIDHRSLIGDESVDVVYVAVPPKFHYEIVMDALKAKKHILCEKPLANSLEEAREMAEAAKKAGVVHGMNFPLNYGQAATKFQDMLRSDFIGNLRQIRLTMHFPQWPRFWQQNSWVGGREQGGFVLEVGVHFIQQIGKLFGEINHIQTELEFPSDTEKCETGILATARLMDGTPILIDGLSGISGEEYLGFTIYGSKGVLSLENWGELRGGKNGEALKEIAVTDQTPNNLINELVKAVQGQDADIYDFEVGYEAQKVLGQLRND